MAVRSRKPFRMLFGQPFRRATNGQAPATLQVFTYLRGLDGAVPGDKSNSDDKGEPAGEKAKADKDNTGQIDPLRGRNMESIPASGRSQIDYLRRMQGRLTAFHEERRRRAGEEGITAIGVIGSDIYDKLLILRALKKHFPDASFFSTDLDASLSLPSEYPTTRNLLVASHFGLELHPDVQRAAPPFRDSYQTSTYFSCLLALDDPKACGAVQPSADKPDPWGIQGTGSRKYASTPDVRNRPPRPLSTDEFHQRCERLVHPGSPSDRHWISDHLGKLLIAVCLVFGLVWFNKTRNMLLSLNPWDYARNDPVPGTSNLLGRLSVAVGLVICVSAGVAVYDQSQPDGEPFVLFEGISIWPSSLIRLAAACLGALLLIKAWRDLSRKSNGRNVGSVGDGRQMVVLAQFADSIGRRRPMGVAEYEGRSRPVAGPVGGIPEAMEVGLEMAGCLDSVFLHRRTDDFRVAPVQHDCESQPAVPKRDVETGGLRGTLRGGSCANLSRFLRRARSNRVPSVSTVGKR